jgi:2-keto-4-pentenoate hydratase/2-oxohepta-3-ene-1,7-dioic acid hydratase in catechol pathway
MPIARVRRLDRTAWVRFDGAEGWARATSGHADLAGLVAGRGETVALDGSQTLAAPLEAGARIVCIGLNYRAHAAESGHAIPARPVVFFRTRESLVGPGAPMIAPAVSDRFDWEGELAVVIGAPGHRIPEAGALSHVLGYCCFNDGSLRDWQKHTSQFSPGKNFDASGAIGPVIATAAETSAPETLRLTTRLNGRVMQDSGIDDLIFPVPALIAYVSSFMALRVGDVIATGTPSGVGGARTPPVFMADGDEVEVAIPGIGKLTNPVRAETR